MTGKGWAKREAHSREDAERRHQLVEAARKVFERRGYRLATIADITEEAGSSRATFYVYFASKMDVFLVLAETVRADFLAAQDISDIDPDDLHLVLTITTDRALAAAVKHRTLITLLDHEAISHPDVKRIWGGIRESTIERTARYLADAGSRGLADLQAAPQTIARMGLGSIEAFALPVVDGRIEHTEAVEEIVRLYVPLVGLKSTERSPSGRCC
jgi:AcrR family transcriptional regulator